MTTSSHIEVCQPKVGDHAEFRKTMTVAEQALFTGISGNMHPLYVNEVHAAGTAAGGRICFELAVTALVTTALAEIGGPFRRLSRLDVQFPSPVRIGETIAAQAQVTEAGPDCIRCSVTCVSDSGLVAAEGTADLVEIAQRPR
jgi:3-hydroxybutyryl-CoA dehydratase